MISMDPNKRQQHYKGYMCYHGDQTEAEDA